MVSLVEACIVAVDETQQEKLNLCMRVGMDLLQGEGKCHWSLHGSQNVPNLKVASSCSLNNGRLGRTSNLSLCITMITGRFNSVFHILISLAAVNAWGKLGHEIVGNLAWTLLPNNVQTKVKQILNVTDPKDCQEYCSPLAIVADWADRVRYFKPWSAPLHFIDVRDDLVTGGCPVEESDDMKCEFQYDRDCKDDICVAGAILNYTSQINDWLVREPNQMARDSSLEESLKFLVHFVGDIHQVRTDCRTACFVPQLRHASLCIAPERQTREAT